jgi:hypothetical protein
MNAVAKEKPGKILIRPLPLSDHAVLTCKTSQLAKSQGITRTALWEMLLRNKDSLRLSSEHPYSWHQQAIFRIAESCEINATANHFPLILPTV